MNFQGERAQHGVLPPRTKLRKHRLNLHFAPQSAPPFLIQPRAVFCIKPLRILGVPSRSTYLSRVSRRSRGWARSALKWSWARQLEGTGLASLAFTWPSAQLPSPEAAVCFARKGPRRPSARRQKSVTDSPLVRAFPTRPRPPLLPFRRCAHQLATLGRRGGLTAGQSSINSRQLF
jgi:hypothetical protein